MTPFNMVNMAKIAGLDIIAVTDHNSAKNCRAAVKAGESAGITVVPGMELCTSEEIHVICLFPDCDSAEAFGMYVYKGLPPIKNKTKVFGNQYIMNHEEEILGEEEILLITASSASIDSVRELVKSYGGACFPAHIDKSATSVISSLGTVPKELGFRFMEITKRANPSELRAKHNIDADVTFLISSDAHVLEAIAEPERSIDLYENTPKALVDFLNRK